MSHRFESYELYLGALYGVLEFFVLPYLAVLVNLYLRLPVWALNFALFVLNFVCLTAIFHRFLWSNLKSSIHAPWKTLRYAGQGLVFYYLLSAVVNLLIIALCPEYINLNNENVTSMNIQGGAIMTFATVCLVPVAEELLFRGLLFRGIYDRKPALAWCVTTVVFSLVHVTGYIGYYEPFMLLLAFIQYLPAGLCLAYAYRKSDNIIAPMLMHMAINQIALSIAG